MSRGRQSDRHVCWNPQLTFLYRQRQTVLFACCTEFETLLYRLDAQPLCASGFFRIGSAEFADLLRTICQLLCRLLAPLLFSLL